MCRPRARTYSLNCTHRPHQESHRKKLRVGFAARCLSLPENDEQLLPERGVDCSIVKQMCDHADRSCHRSNEEHIAEIEAEEEPEPVFIEEVKPVTKPKAKGRPKGALNK